MSWFLIRVLTLLLVGCGQPSKAPAIGASEASQPSRIQTNAKAPAASVHDAGDQEPDSGVGWEGERGALSPFIPSEYPDESEPTNLFPVPGDERRCRPPLVSTIGRLPREFARSATAMPKGRLIYRRLVYELGRGAWTEHQRGCCSGTASAVAVVIDEAGRVRASAWSAGSDDSVSVSRQLFDDQQRPRLVFYVQQDVHGGSTEQILTLDASGAVVECRAFTKEGGWEYPSPCAGSRYYEDTWLTRLLDRDPRRIYAYCGPR